MIVRTIISAGLLGCLIASGTTSAALCRAWRGEPSGRHHRSLGIDVSHYQGTIDWRAVARDHVAFVYVKATEGVDRRDAQFARNWRGAQRARIPAGAYHYFVFCESGRAQAHNFLATAPRSAGALPPAVDLETAGHCHARLTGREMRRELHDFLAPVEARERRRAVLYVTPRFFATYHAYLPKRPMWRRAGPAPNRSWTFWQYRTRGRVAGIRTSVDLDVGAGGRPLAR